MYTPGFWLVNLANFLDGIVYYGFLNLLTLFLSGQVGMSDKLTGLYVAIFSGVVTLLMVPGGKLCDRIGARKSIQLSLALNGVGRLMLLGCAAVHGLQAAVLAAVALGMMSIATGLIQPAVYAGARDHTRAISMAVGFGVLYAIMNSGVVLWNLISPIIRAHAGIVGTYQVLVGVTWVNWLLQVGLFRPRVDRLRPDPTPAPVSEGPALRPIGAEFYFLIFILVPVRTMIAHLWLTLPSVLQRAYSPEVNAHQEWFQGLQPLTLALCAPVLARLLLRQRLVDVMIGGTLLSAASVFLLTLDTSPWVLGLYILLFSIGESVWAARFYEYVARLAPPGRFGAVMGLAHVPWFLAKFTTGLYSGALLAAFVPRTGPVHPAELWAIYGCMAMVTPVGLLLARRHLH
jgi:POT family proton-dependent oligopeptide transporter